MSRFAADSGEGGVTFRVLSAIPAGPVGDILIMQMAAVAELESGLISHGTKAALTDAKRLGGKLRNLRLSAGDTAAAGIAVDSASALSRDRATDVLAFTHQVRLRSQASDV